MERYGMAVIGLGVVGRRMLEQAAANPGLRIVSAWDASAQARAAAAADFPGLPIADDAASSIERSDVDVVYVAVPPLAHAGWVHAAIAARKAVFCEKPLGVDLDESVALVEAMDRSGLPQAINFPFASAAAVDALQRALADPAFGLRAIEVRVRFTRWPRDWQAGAIWLERADQGGFTREVLSHFAWLLHRLRGPLVLSGATLARPAPGSAETALSASIDAGGIPATVSGSVGGASPDRVEARFIGRDAELVLADWYRLEVVDAVSPAGRPFPDLPADPRGHTYGRQLAQLHALLAGRPHTLPAFADALAVQRTIEAMLAERGIER